MEQRTDFFALAKALRARGIPFEQAYEMLFGRPPRALKTPAPSAPAQSQG